MRDSHSLQSTEELKQRGQSPAAARRILTALRFARRRNQNFAGGAFGAFLHGVGAQRPDQHESHSGAAPFNRREALIDARRDARRLFRLRALEIKPDASAVLRFIEKKAGRPF